MITIELRNAHNGDLLPVYIRVLDNPLAHKWLAALEHALDENLHLEKNFCFLGFANSKRDGRYLCEQINNSIQAINQANIGYTIDDYFSVDNCLTDDPVDGRVCGRNLVREKFNTLHKYFEDLQGFSGNISEYYTQADAATRWHIRQLNLLCHEFEAWALSYRKQVEAPEWQRPSQLMCWLNAPRFLLSNEDHQLFGINTINRPLGGVFVGVNKAVGKHHWEVFQDEGRDSRITELTTTSMRSQTEAAADFDIEWGQNPGKYYWQQQQLEQFRQWLIDNGFDPDDPALTIGHPQVGYVDLEKSFGTKNFQDIWIMLNDHLDVYSISTGRVQRVYEYSWQDPDYQQQQIARLQ
jgi:hypothetical protein